MRILVATDKARPITGLIEQFSHYAPSDRYRVIGLSRHGINP